MRDSILQKQKVKCPQSKPWGLTGSQAPPSGTIPFCNLSNQRSLTPHVCSGRELDDLRSPAGATKATKKAGCLAWGLFPLLETQFQLDGEMGAGNHMSRDSEAHMLTH